MDLNCVQAALRQGFTASKGIAMDSIQGIAGADVLGGTSKQKLHVVIFFNGCSNHREEDDKTSDFITPFLEQSVDADAYALVWESQKLHDCATAVSKFLEEQLVGYAAKTVLKTTLLAGLMAAVALPAVLAASASVRLGLLVLCVHSFCLPSTFLPSFLPFLPFLPFLALGCL